MDCTIGVDGTDDFLQRNAPVIAQVNSSAKMSSSQNGKVVPIRYARNVNKAAS